MSSGADRLEGESCPGDGSGVTRVIRLGGHLGGRCLDCCAQTPMISHAIVAACVGMSILLA